VSLIYDFKDAIFALNELPQHWNTGTHALDHSWPLRFEWSSGLWMILSIAMDQEINQLCN
jgi:hypothetical protein